MNLRSLFWFLLLIVLCFLFLWIIACSFGGEYWPSSRELVWKISWWIHHNLLPTIDALNQISSSWAEGNWLIWQLIPTWVFWLIELGLEIVARIWEGWLMSTILSFREIHRIFYALSLPWWRCDLKWLLPVKIRAFKCAFSHWLRASIIGKVSNSYSLLRTV